MQLHLILTFTLSITGLSVFGQAKEAEKQAFIIGERLEFHSNILDEDRMLNIYLPNGYSHDNNKTYPVIYLLDGSKDEDFIHISGLVQFASYPWINMVQESIVIGIENVDRKRDFTFPTTVEKDKVDFPTTGGSEDFIHFIEQELQPYIDSAYKVQNDKTIIGQSLGGLLATEILAKKPDMFDTYIIVSPSLWWDDKSLLDMEFVPYTRSKSVYVGVGQEGKVMKKCAKALHKKLKKSNNPTTFLIYDFLKEQDHGDALHLAVYNAFDAMKMIMVEI
jgi:predicted alpha/beta superfamily hydrolase